MASAGIISLALLITIVAVGAFALLTTVVTKLRKIRANRHAALVQGADWRVRR